MGGGNSKIKVDGIPPRKKMELKSVGSEDNLNFIKIAFYNYPLNEICSTVKIDDDIYIIGTNSSGSDAEIVILKYNLNTGFDSSYTKWTGHKQIWDNSVSAIKYKNDYILITKYGYIFKFNVRTRALTIVITNNSNLVGKNNHLVFYKEEIYLITEVSSSMDSVFKVNVEERKMTRVAYGSSSYRIDSGMEYEGKFLLILQNGQYGYLLEDTSVDIALSIQGSFPKNGNCIKINNKLHLFSQEDTNYVKRTYHYVLENGIWGQKEDMNLDIGLNYRGYDTDIGYICPNIVSRKEAIYYGRENIMIVTDKLYLDKRKE